MQIHHASPTCWSLHGPCPVPEEKPIGICVTHTCQSAASMRRSPSGKRASSLSRRKYQAIAQHSDAVSGTACLMGPSIIFAKSARPTLA